MPIELKIPSLGESITEVEIGEWLVEEGQWVAVDDPVVAIETDKANTEMPAPVSGRLTKIMKRTGEAAAVDDVIGLMEEEAEAPRDAPDAPRADGADEKDEPRVMPAARRAMAERGIETKDVTPSGPGGRVLKEDVPREAPAKKQAPAPKRPEPRAGGPREEEEVRMSLLRRKTAERLLAAQHEAALLTTFNEVDMSAVMALRASYKERFREKYGIKLGFMSFFVKAVIEALKEVPELNGEIRGESVVYRNYYDIGIAVGSGRGLVVPVLRSAERMSFADIELQIADYGGRAKDNSLKLEELQGGTFTISNGGVYGSMLSTPIVNAPQSGILGMHNIVERPVAVDGQVVIRPVMYLALTYDHRIVDGREAVTFLVRVKERIEDPSRILIEV